MLDGLSGETVSEGGVRRVKGVFTVKGADNPPGFGVLLMGLEVNWRVNFLAMEKGLV
jgi:hypothetical protein